MTALKWPQRLCSKQIAYWTNPVQFLPLLKIVRDRKHFWMRNRLRRHPWGEEKSTHSTYTLRITSKTHNVETLYASDPVVENWDVELSDVSDAIFEVCFGSPRSSWIWVLTSFASLKLPGQQRSDWSCRCTAVVNVLLTFVAYPLPHFLQKTGIIIWGAGFAVETCIFPHKGGEKLCHYPWKLLLAHYLRLQTRLPKR